MQSLGLALCLATYLVLTAHVLGFLTVIVKVIRKRLGVIFGLVWVAIGMILLYNIVFNHFFAMFIKPGGPQDLQDDEQLRKEVKQRENRKEARVNVDDHLPHRKGTIEAIAEDDKYVGL